MLEHLALDAADPQDPVFVALREALRSEAIADCELAGVAIWGLTFDHTDCATADTDPVSFNLVHLGPCWEWENLEADPPHTCPLESQCGQFYDCSTEPIILWGGQVCAAATSSDRHASRHRIRLHDHAVAVAGWLC